MPIQFDNLLKPKATEKDKKKTGINFNKLLGNADFKPIPKAKSYTVNTEAAKRIYQSPSPSNEDILALGLGPIKPELATKIVDNLFQRPVLKKPTGWEKREETPKLPIKEEIAAAYNDAWAIADLNRLIKKADEQVNTKITSKDVIDKYSGKPDKLIPFLAGAEDFKEIVKLRGAIKRAETDETTPQDDLLLYKYAQEQGRDSTFGAKVTNVLLNLPSFAGEFMLTGGIYSAGKKAAEEAIVKVLQKYSTKQIKAKLGIKILSSVAGATAQAPIAGLTRIPTGTVQRMLPEYEFTQNDLGKMEFEVTKEGDTLSSALAKAYGDQWVEIVSERSGGLFTAVGKGARDGLIKLGIMKAFFKANPKATGTAFNEWARRAGWNGILNEMGEERLGEAGRAIIGLEEYKLPTPEQLAVELISFSIPGVAINMLGKTNVDVPNKQTPEEIESLIKREEVVVKNELKPKKEEGVTQTQKLDPLTQEARKYKTAEEFVSKMQGSATQYGDYVPSSRLLGLEGYENITKLGIKPDKTITIFRGIDDANGKLPRKINDGDFVTTDFDSALSYAGSQKDVVSMDIKAKDLYVSEPKDFKSEPFYTGAEYIYTTKGGSPMTKAQLTDIWNKAQETTVQSQDTPLDQALMTWNEEKGKYAVQQPVEGAEGKLRKSRAYDRVREEIDYEFRQDVNYNQMNINEQAALAINFTAQQPTLALNIALGYLPPPPNMTYAAIAIAMAEKAKSEGDNKLFAELVQSRSYAQTRRGQEIVMERMVNPDSADFFIREALKAKLNNKISWKWDDDGSPAKRRKVVENIAAQAKTERKDIDKKAAKILQAQKIIDSILC
jgi:hypothetical protein